MPLSTIRSLELTRWISLFLSFLSSSSYSCVGKQNLSSPQTWNVSLGFSCPVSSRCFVGNCGDQKATSAFFFYSIQILNYIGFFFFFFKLPYTINMQHKIKQDLKAPKKIIVPIYEKYNSGLYNLNHKSFLFFLKHTHLQHR